MRYIAHQLPCRLVSTFSMHRSRGQLVGVTITEVGKEPEKSGHFSRWGPLEFRGLQLKLKQQRSKLVLAESRRH